MAQPDGQRPVCILCESVGLVILKNQHLAENFRSDRCFSGNLTCDLRGNQGPSTGEYLPPPHDVGGCDARVC